MLQSAIFGALLHLSAGAEEPGLAIVLAVDQMRRDTLPLFEKELQGGYRRLLEKGRRFPAALLYSDTETGPGHATLATGRNPWSHGIVANEWIDAETEAPVYCVSGPGGPSPENLRAETLGDWMKRANPASRVFSVSAKDRAAVLMGGKGPDGVFWFDAGAGGFTTSAHYGGPPDWLSAFNGDGWLDALPETWVHGSAPWLGPDDEPLEADILSRVSPHPLRSKTKAKFFENLYRSPYVDEWTLRLAGEIVRRFGLGRGAAPDLLCVSLSATDTVGHLYGPRSQEVRDVTLRNDRLLGAFLDALDAEGIRWTLALTSDHGVLPLKDAKRVDLRALLQQIAAPVQARFGAGDWFLVSSGRVTLRRSAIREAKLDEGEVLAAIAAAARASPAVASVYAAEELRSREPTEDPILALARRSWHPGRGGDLLLVPREFVLVSKYGTGTSHGSPWPYDREIPLLFCGAGVVAGTSGEECSSADLAPTIARRFRIPVPEGVEGRALALE